MKSLSFSEGFGIRGVCDFRVYRIVCRASVGDDVLESFRGLDLVITLGDVDTLAMWRSCCFEMDIRCWREGGWEREEIAFIL